MENLVHILGLDINTGPALITGGLVLTRIFMVINLIPFLFGNPVPGMIKLGASFIFLIIVFPFVHGTVPEAAYTNFLFVIVLFFKEAFYGIAIGLMVSLIFYGFDAAGQVIDNQRGASMAQIFSPTTGTQVTIFGSFTFQLAIVLFLTLGGHRLFLYALLYSYNTLPVYEMPTVGLDFMPLIEQFIKISGAVLFVAAQLAAPVLISIFVVDLILGIMNRISPAINVLNLGFTIRGIMGVIIVFISLSAIAYQMNLISMESVENVKQAIQSLAG